MSEWEYDLARRAGFPPTEIIVNGLGWSDEFIGRVVGDGARLINIDNSADLHRIADASKRMGRITSVGVRIVPPLRRTAFADVGSKLGAPVATGEAASLLEEATRRAEIRCIGISVHACHRTRDTSFVADVAQSTARFAYEQRERLKLPLEILDCGGGIDERASVEQCNVPVRAFCESVAAATRMLGRHVRAVIEPGRFLVGDAGIVLTTVQTVKASADRRWLIVDAGSNLLIPIPSAHYAVFAIHDLGEPSDVFSVADGTCSPTSVIQANANLPRDIRRGSVLAIAYAGSYTLSMAESWAYPIPKVVMVDGDSMDVLLDSETAKRMFYDLAGGRQPACD